MKVYRDIVVNGTTTQTEIFDIAECTYSGKDMGERSITANIKWATPIDFKIGDYVVLQMQTLIRSTTGVDGSVDSEKFYLYTMPTIKKNASPMSSGQAFEHTVTFYSAQYELGLVQMRDCGQEQANVDTIIYTGFDSLSFVGGADELMRRIMAVLKEAYHDTDGNPLWSYKIADAVNENKNTALERVSLSFSGNSVMDALLKLNDEEGLNTTFFINGRTIYVGYKRPYFCRVTDGGSIDTAPSSQMFQFQYGKTSHQPIALGHGGLYQITKALGKESPITKLFAYGAARNLNRYYCSDRIQSGRYVNRLMLPSFDADGKTDYILSDDSIKKYGIREGSKQFEEIYPSLRYITYGDLRQIKYCIKIKSSGITNDKLEQGNSAYPVARVQCYKVVPSGKTTGINKLVEAAPPDDLCVIVHAMGKTVKVVLYGGNTDSEAIAKQRQHDSKVPTRTANGTNYIPGSCFLVHDRGFDSGKTYQCANRSEWFSNPNNISSLSDVKRAEINMNQIQYEDTFWLSDLYVFEGYQQTHFSRDGYSAWSWPRTTTDYQSGSADSTIVNEVVAVEPIVIEDTSSNVDDLETQQKTFDIYLKDVGFKIDEQNDFGDMVFVVGTELKISMLDGLMAGREFTAAGKVVDNQYTCICAYNEDGSLNNDFFMDSDYNKGDAIPKAALAAGAIWRICCNRINLDEADYSNLNLILPTKDLCVKKGDHLVFLDIFMPDIYIHAAENRLLREARKYLNANDNGSVSYSAQFDKVRLQQIPNYALQMREGLNIRMVDDDLGISTDNDGRYLSNYGNDPLYSSIIINTNGASAWLSSNDAVDFTKGRFYTFTCYIKDNASLATNHALALFSVKNDGIDAAKFLPTYSLSTDKNKKSGYIHLTFKFELPSNFNDDVVYYPSLQFKANNNSSIGMWVESVYEKDYADGTEKLNYADFTIDSLTVKMTNSNSDTAPIREITATFSENPAATAWATLMSNIENTRIAGEQSEKAIETLVNTARKNYQTLLNLKNSIFDPDGTCDQTFLQVMMMQVGADSMNYQLDKTRTGLSAGGQQVFHNCKIEKVGSNWHFKVANADTLRHYVYTQGAQGGTWAITSGLDQELDGASNYFICLKCSREGNAGEWICSTKQYAVNDTEDTNSWFFNWGILTVDGGGDYTLVETRGNAYMYGDNLVCGKISTLAGNSYFDLNNGDFVLSNGTEKALSYENGILTIGGINDGDADSILAKLGIIEVAASNAQSAADSAKANAQTALTTLNNIASDNVFTKQEKCSVRTEWASIQAEFAKNTNNAKVCWGESGYTSNTEYAAYKTAYNNLNSYLTNTAKLSANEDTQITPADFNKAFSDYYGANVTLLNAIAKRVSEIEVAAMSMGTRNLFAKKYMLDWNAKSAGTTTVNFDDYGEYYQIKENQVYTYVGGGTSYNDILQGNVSFETGKQYCLKVKWRVPSEVQYNGLDLGFKYSDGTRSSWIICSNNQTTPIEATLVSASGKTVAGIVCTYGTRANTCIYEIQLTEGNKAPSGWTEAEADKETGGENIYTGDNPLTIAANATSNYNYVTLVKNLQNNARYVFSCGKSVVKAGSTTEYGVLLCDFNAQRAAQARKLAVGITRVEQAFTIPSTGTWSMLIYSGVNGSTAGISMEFTDIMVQKGNRATAYQTAVGFLGKAIKDGTTDVAGGLVLTNVLMLRDFDNKTVTAGMSGLTEKDGEIDNVLLWGGGTYQEAFYASRDANYLKEAGGTPITTLIKKDGTGKIGIFRIEKDKVAIRTANGTVVIDDDEGITVFDNNEKEKVLITPKAIDINSLVANTDLISSITGTKTLTKQLYQDGSLYVYSATLYKVSANAVSELCVKKLKVQITVNTSSILGDSGYYGYIYLSVGSDTKKTDFRYTGGSGFTGSLDVTLNETALKKYSLSEDTNISVSVSIDTHNGSGNQPPTINSITAKVTCEECYILKQPARTVIGNNGIFSMIDKNKLFAIVNGENKQEVYMRGLPTSKPPASGQLWKSGDYLKIT